MLYLLPQNRALTFLILNTNQRKDIERFKNQDLEICSHPHELLVSITETDQLLPPTILHQWDSVHVRSSTSASASLAVPTKLTHENLKLIHGFRDLGTFQLPATEVSDPAGVHRYLTSLVPNSNDTNSPASSDAGIISFILSHLQSLSSSSSLQTVSVSVHFFAVLVLSNTRRHFSRADRL